MALVILHVLYETLKGVVIAQGRKAELSQLPYMDVGMQRSDIILRCGGVSICVYLCRRLQGERVESLAMYSSATRSVHLG